MTGVLRKRSPSENPLRMNRVILCSAFALLSVLSGKLALYVIIDISVFFYVACVRFYGMFDEIMASAVRRA